MRRQVYFVASVLLLLIALPGMAVLSLGSGTLLFLGHSSASNDTTSAVSTTTIGLYEGPAISGDTYAWGNCTYWAYALRLQASSPIPTNWGNANTWAIRALLAGYSVDHHPSAGAIMQTDRGNLGHVAYVTAIDVVTGAWTISEMNVQALDVVDTKTYPALDANNYSFIHDKVTDHALPL